MLQAEDNHKIQYEASLKFLTLWAINGELDREKLCFQLREMKRLKVAPKDLECDVDWVAGIGYK